MRYFRKQISLIAAAIMILNLVACSIGNKKITVDDILSVSTKQDVDKCFGNPSSKESPTSYRVSFFENEFLVLVTYSGDDVEEIRLDFFYPSMSEISMDQWSNFVPSLDEFSNARSLADDILISFTEKLGEPSIYKPTVDTATYTWSVDGCSIKFNDFVNDKKYAKLGPIEIVIEYELPHAN